MDEHREDALARVADALRCPVCGATVAVDARGVRCVGGHVFDRARQGYASLLARPLKFHGDDAPMIAARRRVLDSGLYRPVLEAVAAAGAAAMTASPGRGASGPVTAVDLGCGTGHYLAGVLDRAASGAGDGRRDRPARVRGIGVDASKPAVRAAARAHPEAAALLADAWGALPLADASAQLIMSVFAPRNAAACRRVLAPGGAVLVAAPEPGHLAELVDGLGLVRVDRRKGERLASTMTGFDRTHADEVRWTMRPGTGLIEDIVGMGPSARHHDARRLADAVAALPPDMEVTGHVTVRIYRRSAGR